MGSLDKRIECLEQRIRPPEQDKAAALQTALIRDILDEFASLTASRAVHYRGGKRIEPENIPGTILGPSYTTEDVWELAVRRVRERRGGGRRQELVRSVDRRLTNLERVVEARG